MAFSPRCVGIIAGEIRETVNNPGSPAAIYLSNSVVVTQPHSKRFGMCSGCTGDRLEDWAQYMYTDLGWKTGRNTCIKARVGRLGAIHV